MVYVIIKTQHSKKWGNYYTYAELRKSVRIGKKVKSVFVKYLGRVKGLDIINKKDIELLYKKYNYSCAICKSQDDLTIDHIIPRSNDGTNDVENLQILCKKCNNHKADNSPKVTF